jgi:hypothetical protein
VSILHWKKATRRIGALALLAVTVVGCSDLVAKSPLSESRRSPEALARAALEALRDSDQDALAALRVGRDEYETLLWPELPDRNHAPFEFVWSITHPRSRKARRIAVEEYGGLPLELVRVDLGEEIGAYESFTVYRNARMTVRRTDTGQEGTIPLMDAVIEMGGGWKFLNFAEEL